MSLEYITDSQRKLAGSSGLSGVDDSETFSVGIDLKGAGIRTLNTVAEGDDEECEECEEALDKCEAANKACRKANAELTTELEDIKADLAPPDAEDADGCWSGGDEHEEWYVPGQHYNILTGFTALCLTKKDDNSGEYFLSLATQGTYTSGGTTIGVGLSLYVQFQNKRTGLTGLIYKGPVTGNATFTVFFDADTEYDVLLRWTYPGFSGSQVVGSFSSPVDRFNDVIFDKKYRVTVEVDVDGNIL